MKRARAQRPEHAAFEGEGGVPLSRARGTDQERLGWVFQGAALLAHLDHAGFLLGEGDARAWEAARIDAAGLLRVDASLARPGRRGEPLQVLLLSLLRRAFRIEDGDVAGRGAARRVARRLQKAWGQTLVPFPANAVLAQILDDAPFLWREGFAAARHALAATHFAERSHPWLVGPGGARRRFLRRATDRQELEDLLSRDEARDLWLGLVDEGDGVPDPRDLAARGRWARAAALVEKQGPSSRSARLDRARWLRAAGRAEDALEALGKLSSPAALVVRLGCQFDLGEDHAARKTLRRLGSSEPTPEELVEVADLGVRLAAKGKGRRDEIVAWVERLEALIDDPSTPPLVAADARLTAAEAAWDLGDRDAMARRLERARPSVEGHPRLLARWHHAEGLRRYSENDSAGAVEHVARAVALGRRIASRPKAAKLWSELGVFRVQADDLAGAERACRQAVRLFLPCQGSKVETLGLHNLAEIRIRRGRFAGVEATIERSLSENRRTANVRGMVHDLVLLARLELNRGRMRAALARIAEARPRHEAGCCDVIVALEARALGWLGRAERAAEVLEESLDREESLGLEGLDPEERPALWALANRPDEASRAAENGPWCDLWKALLAGEDPGSSEWEALDELEPFRAARVIVDIESLRPGVTPPARAARASVVLRQAGAGELAELLESRTGGAWRALRRYFESDGESSPRALDRLLRETGHDGVRLSVVAVEESGSDAGGPTEERVLVAGEGGEHALEAPLPGGCLVLRTAAVDEVLETVFALVLRDLRRPASVSANGAGSNGAGSNGAGSNGAGSNGDETDDLSSGTDGPSLVDAAGDGIIGRSAGLLGALDRLDRLAGGRMPVLLLGESGTGKELAARRVHRKSGRSGEFLPLNCAAFSESLIQSELFGHARGAFTGADTDRAGVFESARGGTVFLDEIGDLPLQSQGNLLRVLQEGEVRRVGESRARKVDARIVAATHRDLAAMVEAGEFRKDLFFRLKVAAVELPPLRARGDDVALLCRHFLVRFGDPAIDPAAEAALVSHPWPGNIRELRNVLEVAAALAGDGVIGPEHLDLPPVDAAAPVPEGAVEAEIETASEAPLGDYHRLVEDYRRRLLSEALRRSEGNKAEAARRLGLTRQALSYLVRQLDLM